MKRFCIKVSALMLILGALIWGLGWAFRQTTTYQNMEIDDWTIDFYTMPETIDIAVVGASHGKRSFDFSPYTEKSFNFSMSSQTPRYDLRMLREYGDRFEEGVIVVSTVSPIFMYYPEPEGDFERKQQRYYRVLSPENIIECDFGRWCLGRFSPVLTENTNTVINAFLRPPELTKGVDLAQTFCVEQSVLDGEMERIQRDHIGAIAEVFPEPDPLMYSAFEEMAQLCRKRGWRLIWVTPPYTRDYLKCFGDDFFPTFYRQMNELAEKYGVPFLDYSHDSRFIDDCTLFRNIDHLNIRGQRLFTEIVMKDMESIF